MRRFFIKLLTFTMLYLGLWFVCFFNKRHLVYRNPLDSYIMETPFAVVQISSFPHSKNPNLVVISGLCCYLLVT